MKPTHHMTQDSFGTPSARDQTARTERIVNTVQDRITKIFPELAQNYGRALGSTPTPKADEFAEYVAAHSGPPEATVSHYTFLINQWKDQGYTLAEITDMLHDYEKRNEAQLAEIGRGKTPPVNGQNPSLY